MQLQRYKERYFKNPIDKKVLDEQQIFAYGEMFEEFCKVYIKEFKENNEDGESRVPMMSYIDKLAPLYRQWVNKFLAKVGITDEETRRHVSDYLIHQVQPTIMKMMGVASK